MTIQAETEKGSEEEVITVRSEVEKAAEDDFGADFFQRY